LVESSSPSFLLFELEQAAASKVAAAKPRTKV